MLAFLFRFCLQYQATFEGWIEIMKDAVDATKVCLYE